MTRTPRRKAFEILLKIEKDKAYSNLALDSAVRENSPDSADRAFISRLVYGVTERKITLDYIFSRYLKKNSAKLSPEVLTVLRLGTYQLIFLDKVPSSAAVNESVKLANIYCKYASGLVNAVLRRVSESGGDYLLSLSGEEKLSVMYSVPIELLRFFIYHYGEENTKAFFEASLKEKEVTLRVNTLKITAEKLKEELFKEGVEAEFTFLDTALKIKKQPKPLYELEAYKNGYFHIQDISSQLCALSLNAKPSKRVLDVCASPGGKSFSIAENALGKAEVVSCDIYPQRVRLIEEGAKRLGLNIKAVLNDGAVYSEELGEFDRVLCDVPCSGLGIIGKKPEIKYKKLDDIKELIPIQKRILETSSQYVKSGGTLIYSTCSVNPNENRRVCDAFLNSHPEFKSVKVLPDLKRAVDEGDYLTLMPHINDCDGFFIAEFCKD